MKRVLIIEDAPNFQRWLQRAASRLIPGCVTTVVADAAQAEALLNCRSYDTVVLDLAIPASAGDHRPAVSTGLRLLQKVGDLARRPQVVVVSSHGDLAETCESSGASAFIDKADARLFDRLRTALTGAAE